MRLQCVAHRRTVLPAAHILPAKTQPRIYPLKHLAPFAVVHDLDANIDCLALIVEVNRTDDLARRNIAVHRANVTVVRAAAFLRLLCRPRFNVRLRTLIVENLTRTIHLFGGGDAIDEPPLLLDFPNWDIKQCHTS